MQHAYTNYFKCLCYLILKIIYEIIMKTVCRMLQTAENAT